MARRIMPRLVPLTISLLIAIMVVVPAAYLSFPYAYRWWKIQGLTAADSARREASLAYVANQAAKQRHVLDKAIEALDVESSRNFSQIVHAIDLAGQWSRPNVPLNDWLRWIKLTAAQGAADARIAAAQSLADLPQHADRPEVVNTLATLMDDPKPDVRFNAMIAAAELFSNSDQNAGDYEQMIGSAVDDQPAIARHAWIILGLINPMHGFNANWQNAPPLVAEAILWTAAKTNPQRFGVNTPVSRIDRQLLPAVAYSMGIENSKSSQQWLTNLLPANRTALNELGDQRWLSAWRATLGIDLTAKVERKLHAWLDWKNQSDEADSTLALRLAAANRLGRPTPLTSESPKRAEVLTLLARLESPRNSQARENSSSLPGSIPETWAPLLRVAGLDDVAQPKPKDLALCFQSKQSAMRDIACLAAVEQFDRKTLKPFVAQLLRSYDDQEKMAGAVIAGLSGLQTKLLGERYALEDMAQVKQVMALGLWMAQDHVPSLNNKHAVMDPGNAQALLARKHFGIRSTVLLAMLERGQRHPKLARQALDFLLNPRGEPNFDLLELLGTLRWIRVLDHYLPLLFESEVPRFWLWADPGLQSFQLDVLRDWYLLRRSTLGQ